MPTTQRKKEGTMIKRYYDSETYRKIGSPDLGSIIFVIKSGKRIYGKVGLIHFTGEKSKHKGKIQLGVIPFENKKGGNNE